MMTAFILSTMMAPLITTITERTPIPGWMKTATSAKSTAAETSLTTIPTMIIFTTSGILPPEAAPVPEDAPAPAPAAEAEAAVQAETAESPMIWAAGRI